MNQPMVVSHICINLHSLSFDSPDLVIQFELICINYKSAHSFSYIISLKCKHQQLTVINVATAVDGAATAAVAANEPFHLLPFFYSSQQNININIMEWLVAKKQKSLNDGEKKAIARKKRKRERTNETAFMCLPFFCYNVGVVAVFICCVLYPMRACILSYFTLVRTFYRAMPFLLVLLMLFATLDATWIWFGSWIYYCFCLYIYTLLFFSISVHNPLGNANSSKRNISNGSGNRSSIRI